MATDRRFLATSQPHASSKSAPLKMTDADDVQKTSAVENNNVDAKLRIADATALAERQLVPQSEWAATLRQHRLALPGAEEAEGVQLICFYDGRQPDRRLFSSTLNWLDDGAYALGTAVYAMIDGARALLIDAGMTREHGAALRDALRAHGVDLTQVRVVLTHWHRDHVAGAAELRRAGAQVLARAETVRLLAAATPDPPEVESVVVDCELSDDETTVLALGSLPVELTPVDIHTRDGLCVRVPQLGLVFAGDTLEDSCTYVDEPADLRRHLVDLRRMRDWPNVTRILPAHGSEEKIVASGYDVSLIDATIAYIEKLLTIGAQPDLQSQSLREFASDQFEAGCLCHFAPYELVHRENVKQMLEQ